MTCKNCRLYCTDPVNIGCDHLYCYNCIEKIIPLGEKEGHCKICKKEFDPKKAKESSKVLKLEDLCIEVEKTNQPPESNVKSNVSMDSGISKNTTGSLSKKFSNMCFG